MGKDLSILTDVPELSGPYFPILMEGQEWSLAITLGWTKFATAICCNDNKYFITVTKMANCLETGVCVLDVLEVY